MDDETGERFLDPSNCVYHAAFKEVWPSADVGTDQETVGDLVEAFLGWAWVLRKLERHGRVNTMLPGIAHDVIHLLETMFLAEYSLRTWWP